MNLLNKKVLTIDLTKHTWEIKTYPELNKYIGGVALGFRLYELYQKQQPLILAIGPLNGFFPFASKTAVIYKTQGEIEDVYLGGYLSARLRFAGLDAVVLLGISPKDVVIDIENDAVNFRDGTTNIQTLGLPGKKTVIEISKKMFLVDQYFESSQSSLKQVVDSKNIRGLVITGTNTYSPKNMAKYKELFGVLLNRASELSEEKGFFPSCGFCPMGCENSKFGETKGNAVIHSLVACQAAEKIYADAGTIFSCLNVLGYNYTHEDIENLPTLIQNSLKNIGK